MSDDLLLAYRIDLEIPRTGLRLEGRAIDEGEQKVCLKLRRGFRKFCVELTKEELQELIETLQALHDFFEDPDRVLSYFRLLKALEVS